MATRKKLTTETIRRIIKEEKARLNGTLEMGLSHPSEVSKRTKGSAVPFNSAINKSPFPELAVLQS